MSDKESFENLGRAYMEHLINGLRIFEAVETATGETLRHAEAHREAIAELSDCSPEAVGMAIFQLVNREQEFHFCMPGILNLQ